MKVFTILALAGAAAAIVIPETDANPAANVFGKREDLCADVGVPASAANPAAKREADPVRRVLDDIHVKRDSSHYRVY